MIVINTNEDNNIVVTINERVQNKDSFILFKVVSKFDNSEEREVFIDVTYNKRYDEFNLKELDNPTLDNEISLFNGEWDYFIYEEEDSNNITYDNLLEMGLLLVKEK